MEGGRQVQPPEQNNAAMQGLGIAAPGPCIITWTMHYRAKLMPRVEGGVIVPLSVSLSLELRVSLRGL